MPCDEKATVSGLSSDATARKCGGGGGGGYCSAKTHPLGIHHTQLSLGSTVDLINKSTPRSSEVSGSIPLYEYSRVKDIEGGREKNEKKL